MTQPRALKKQLLPDLDEDKEDTPIENVMKHLTFDWPHSDLVSLPTILHPNTQPNNLISREYKIPSRPCLSRDQSTSSDSVNSVNSGIFSNTEVGIISPPLKSFKSIEQCLTNNKMWADSMTTINPLFFSKLAALQAPQVLWIGCSDSRVPANQLLLLGPGEVFVHRNVGNVVHSTDFNCLSVVQFAVDVLKVKNIIICGHYGCGGVLASMTANSYGLVDNWLRPIKDLYKSRKASLENIKDFKDKADMLCELNVANSVQNLVESSIVQATWARNQELHIYGWCYRLTDGCIRDLGIHVNSVDSLDPVDKLIVTSSK